MTYILLNRHFRPLRVHSYAYRLLEDSHCNCRKFCYEKPDQIELKIYGKLLNNFWNYLIKYFELWISEFEKITCFFKIFLKAFLEFFRTFFRKYKKRYPKRNFTEWLLKSSFLNSTAEIRYTEPNQKHLVKPLPFFKSQDPRFFWKFQKRKKSISR